MKTNHGTEENVLQESGLSVGSKSSPSECVLLSPAPAQSNSDVPSICSFHS